jgi:calcium-dependent protein kinase
MGVCSSSQLAVEARAKPGKSRAQQVSAQPAPAQPAPAQPAPSQPAPARVFAPPEQLGLEVTGPSLGKGAFGEVVRAIRRVDGNPVGLKMISKITFRGEEERRLMLLEARLAQRASHPHHPNVVTTYEYAEDAATFYMVMELASGGELMERITRHSVFSEAVAARYFAQLAEGLAHIHKQGVVHRDLKPENFLMEDASEGATVKITDFGLSDEIAEPDAELSDPCGSAFYIAPEVFKRKYTRAADVFSLGVNLFLFLSGTVPFGARAESEEMIYHAIQREPLRFGEEWQQISAAARELVGGLLEKDPTKRYTLEQALAHPWVHGAPDKPLDKSLLSSLLSFNARNKFKKIALRLVASNMTAAAVAQLRTEFMKIDVDNTGTITHKEMKQALEGMGGMGSVDPDALTALIKNVDIDGDGVIR